MATVAAQTTKGGKNKIDAFKVNATFDAPDGAVEYEYDALKDGQTKPDGNLLDTTLTWQNYRYDAVTQTYIDKFDVSSETEEVVGNIENGDKIKATSGGSEIKTILIWYAVDTTDNKVAVWCFYGNYIAPFSPFSESISTGTFAATQCTLQTLANANDITIPIAAFDTDVVTAPAADVVIPAGQGLVKVFLDPKAA